MKKRVALDAIYVDALSVHGESVQHNDPALALEIADLLGRAAPDAGMALSYSPASLPHHAMIRSMSCRRFATRPRARPR